MILKAKKHISRAIPHCQPTGILLGECEQCKLKHLYGNHRLHHLFCLPQHHLLPPHCLPHGGSTSSECQGLAKSLLQMIFAASSPIILQNVNSGPVTSFPGFIMNVHDPELCSCCAHCYNVISQPLLSTEPFFKKNLDPAQTSLML